VSRSCARALTSAKQSANKYSNCWARVGGNTHRKKVGNSTKSEGRPLATSADRAVRDSTLTSPSELRTAWTHTHNPQVLEIHSGATQLALYSTELEWETIERTIERTRTFTSAATHTTRAATRNAPRTHRDSVASTATLAIRRDHVASTATHTTDAPNTGAVHGRQPESPYQPCEAQRLRVGGHGLRKVQRLGDATQSCVRQPGVHHTHLVY
jgi:hypothetical protein